MATRLSRLGANDTDLLRAAVLHDVVEDCYMRVAATQSAALAVLGYHHGTGVAQTVRLLTVPFGANYLEHVTAAVTADPRALLVKISDWIDNAGSLHHSPTVPERLVRKYHPMTEVFLGALDQSRNATDHLLQGNSDELEKKVVRVGDRLVELSQRPSPGQSGAHATLQPVPARRAR